MLTVTHLTETQAPYITMETTKIPDLVTSCAAADKNDGAGADAGDPSAASTAATDGGSGGADGDDLRNGYKPPDHVTTGAVYSNAYRKSLASKKDKEGAKADARKASRIFKIHGLVTPELCGKFSSQPRKKQASKAAAEESPAEEQVEADVAEVATEP